MTTPSQQSSTNAQVTSDLNLILSTLQGHPALGRALTDPSAPVAARSKLIDRAFAKVSPAARTILGEALAKNWDSTKTLLNWVEATAVKSAWQWAQTSNELDRCLDEVFAFSQMIFHDHELRSALTDRRRSLADRQGLVRSLLSKSMAEPSVEIAAASVAVRQGTIDEAVRGFLDIGAGLVDSQIATVSVAKPLDAKQKKDLISALSTRMGTNIIIQEIVDPSLLGGVRVECGAEVIDSTLTSRLEAAHREFA
ncbi:MAG: F0F1 ATP synthase subunit delta [Propionibacteriaceae bacterium]|nr:F0F1 ATP synthase subunit delta [Propionibacteriaceae bacterium]